MQFRRFNDAGIEAFREYLQRLRAEPTSPPPLSLLTNNEVSAPLTPAISAEPDTFDSRMDFARWLHTASEAADATIPRGDAGFWAWLSLALFDQVCPVDGNGMRTVREDARYIAMLQDARRHYRHLLFGPYSIFHLHRDDPDAAGVLLYGELTTLGHHQYQIASRKDLLGNKNVLSAATLLYIDEQTGRTKRGSVSQRNGSVFRFVRIVNQLERVWDLMATDARQIIEMLPSEFDRFKSPRSLNDL